MILILLVCLFNSARALIPAPPEGATNAQLVDHWFRIQAMLWVNLMLSCRTVVLLFTDGDWADLTTELMVDLARFGDYQRCVAIWYWKSANQTMHDEPGVQIPIYVDSRSATVGASSIGSSDWGGKLYFDKIAQRIPISHAILRDLTLARVGLALIDSDIVLFRNVLRRMEKQNKPLIIQQETSCTYIYNNLCVNGGFWRAQGEEGLEILKEVAKVMQQLQLPDQDAFDIVLNRFEYRDKVVYLSRHQYVNGYTYQHDPQWRLNASHIVHVNWVAGGVAEKRKLLRKLRGRTPLTLEALLAEK